MGLMIVRPNESQHFRDRLYQRYGITLSPSEVCALKFQVHKLLKIVEDRGQTAIATLPICGKVVYVVWDKIHQTFVTALSPNRDLEWGVTRKAKP